MGNTALLVVTELTRLFGGTVGFADVSFTLGAGLRPRRHRLLPGPVGRGAPGAARVRARQRRLLALPAAPAYGAVPAALLPVGILAAGYRAATRPPMSYGGAAVDTPFGLIPVDLIRQLTRGPDALGLVLLAQLLVSRRG
jgi:hypothetical protein